MRCFALTDVHGKYNLYKKAIAEIKRHAPENEEYKIFFLGDAADRGPDGYKLMKDLLFDEHIVYLYGNHEDLFVKAAHAIIEICKTMNAPIKDFFVEFNEYTMYNLDADIKLHIINGGYKTLKDWGTDIPKVSMDVLNKIENLPRTVTYENYDMCHAGCNQCDWMKDEHEMIWNRNHMFEPWFDNRTLIHGHTPTKDDSKRIDTRYNNNSRKINLDAGTYHTENIRIYDFTEDRIFYVSNKTF